MRTHTGPHAHSARIERWLGAAEAERLSRAMRGYHSAEPIPVANMPGRICVNSDGEFVGRILGGSEACLAERMRDELRRRKLYQAIRYGKATRQHGGFASLSDLISEMTAGKSQYFTIAKTGVTGVANVANSLWDVGAVPAAGGTSSAAAGSTPDNTTVGGLLQANASGSDTLHFIGATMTATVGNNLLLMYDRFFQVNHNIATDPQSVSGVSSRYQDTTSKGSFITVFVTTALGAGTPTYTITYMDQDGNTAEAATAQTIVGSAIARRFPFATSVGNGWFIPLNSGDTGVRKVTNLDLSAASTGNVDVVLGKPLVWIPTPVANQGVIIDGINSMINLVEIIDNACLAFMEINKGATTATSYNGQIILASG